MAGFLGRKQISRVNIGFRSCHYGASTGSMPTTKRLDTRVSAPGPQTITGVVNQNLTAAAHEVVLPILDFDQPVAQ